MSRPCLGLVLAVVVLLSCGGTSNTPTGPTAAGVTAQTSDLPSGLVKCDLTGDIQSFISKEQTPDPQAAKSIAADWEAAKKDGATAAYAALYTDSTEHCNGIKRSATDLGAATYKLVVNFVIQYRDEKSATAAFKGDHPIFGFSPFELSSGAGGVVEGSKTGLTANSIALTQPVGNQLFYIALWQNKQFMVILTILNIDANAAKSAAMRENSRIK